MWIDGHLADGLLRGADILTSTSGSSSSWPRCSIVSHTLGSSKVIYVSSDKLRMYIHPKENRVAEHRRFKKGCLTEHTRASSTTMCTYRVGENILRKQCMYYDASINANMTSPQVRASSLPSSSFHEANTDTLTMVRT